MLSYEDVGEAVDWLSRAFGFNESGQRFADDEGRVNPAELRSPKRHAEECEQAARWLATPWVVDGVHVEVADLNAHYDRARAAGATIIREPEDLPFGRLYSAADLEGPPLDVHAADVGGAVPL